MTEKRIQQLYNRLMALGYTPFQVDRILQETIGITNITAVNDGQHEDMIRILEYYERLGTEYLCSYSK